MTKSNFVQVKQYVEGIVLSDLNNTVRISEALDGKYHKLQNFISDSTRVARSLIDEVAFSIDRCLPRQTLNGLLLDERGWIKKGNKSVGFGHQYCDNVEKTANSQVTYFSCLCNDKYAAFPDSRLYLPESRCSDASSCDEAGITVSEWSLEPSKTLQLIL